MRAVVMQGLHRPLALETVPDPTPGAGDMVVRVGRCGICGSDLHMTEDAAYGQGAGSILLGLPIEQLGLCSTGKIGEPLDGRIFVQTLPRLGDELSTDATTFNQAICTTDLFLKRAAVDLALSGGTIRITAPPPRWMRAARRAGGSRPPARW